jgi:hypothetical protein
MPAGVFAHWRQGSHPESIVSHAHVVREDFNLDSEGPLKALGTHIPAKKAFLFSITLNLLQLSEIMTDLQFTEFFYRRL